jgi:hypothetical protein
MSEIAGITIERTGDKQFVHIDLEKHQTVRRYLESIGAIERDEFEGLAEQCTSIEDLRTGALNYVNELYGRI